MVTFTNERMWCMVIQCSGIVGFYFKFRDWIQELGELGV